MQNRPTIQIVCANSATAGQYVGEMRRCGDAYNLVCDVSARTAAENAALVQPDVVLFDESAILSDNEAISTPAPSPRASLTRGSLTRGSVPQRPSPAASGAPVTEAAGKVESIVARLTEVAPVVIVAASEREPELRFLITSGAVDFVPRRGNFAKAAAEFVERRVGLAALASGSVPRNREEFANDFGEILRHEVNNPLTGILGNAELLLSRRDRLPPSAVARVETIAELAVRLREIVRRLSNSWGMRDHARSASH